MPLRSLTEPPANRRLQAWPWRHAAAPARVLIGQVVNPAVAPRNGRSGAGTVELGPTSNRCWSSTPTVQLSPVQFLSLSCNPEWASHPPLATRIVCGGCNFSDLCSEFDSQSLSSIIDFRPDLCSLNLESAFRHPHPPTYGDISFTIHRQPQIQEIVQETVRPSDNSRLQSARCPAVKRAIFHIKPQQWFSRRPLYRRDSHAGSGPSTLGEERCVPAMAQLANDQ